MGPLFAAGRSPSAGATAAPAGNLFGTRGGRLISLELDGLVVGGLVETVKAVAVKAVAATVAISDVSVREFM